MNWITTPFFVFSFSVAFLVFHPLFVISWYINKSLYRRIVDFSNYVLIQCLKIVGSKVTVSGLDRLPSEKAYIFVSNHQSLYDIPLLIWYLRKFRPRFIAKKELGKGLPSVSHALRHMGSALIDRSSSQQSLSTIETFGKQAAADCASAVIFPEGTRARAGSMKRFKTGGLKVLLKSMPEISVVPIAIRGSWELLKNKMLPVPFGVKIELIALDPIMRSEASDETIPDLVEHSIKARVEASS